MTADTQAAPDNTDLTREELVRYSRHILLPQVGEAGQRTLKRSRVLLVGAGGLGSPVALYLAAAGVGTLGLVDFDTVDLSNLQRQILHGSASVGSSKIDSAHDRLVDINPNVSIEAYRTRLTSENALEIARGYDLIVDGTDNFATRYLVNDTSVLLGIANVYGSVYRFEGQASVFGAPDGPCYRCLFRDPPPPDLVPSCAEGGVLGVVPGLVGTIQASEAIKLLLGLGDTLVGKLLTIDVLKMAFRTLTIQKDPSCPACGTHEITELIDYDEFCSGPASHAVTTVQEIQPAQLASRLEKGEKLEIIDVREPYEWEIGHIPGARLVPLANIAAEIPRLDKRRETILYCKVGARSMHAAQQLAEAGVSDVRNLAGGILRWIDEVDPTMARY
ncbi:MAG TPA: molybdopterin-synthase adenylyltransferase MoeB [Gemmatimonadaceae bacterium]|jgi:adenylyltransferase/sulfurtransferase|nr:molybdopterin-synthase adenylyltransferase MoeB [Gemmatimonadaceae bacterium]